MRISIQWNPSIVATIRDQPFGLYRGVATSQGLFYIIDKTCTCMVYIESNIILHRMKIIIKCDKYNENMYIHGTESNKILDM